ncbi:MULTISPECIES: hypothetical protein [unclassified Serratia (in: enterobacteria)]|uniref:hypothetical protein n=1 Tax=unclassified Serratia (in: enterobacteria) TaxID=2647522 RepID=UPI000469E993|nr:MULTISPECIES: hypothetical protein [unclassified Serratia (in: enterobacteria)]
MIFNQPDILAFEHFNKDKFVAMPILWLENEFDYVDSPLVRFLQVRNEKGWRSLNSKEDYITHLKETNDNNVKYTDELNEYINAYNNEANVKVVVDFDITSFKPDYQLVDLNEIYEERMDYDFKELYKQCRSHRDSEENAFLNDLNANNLTLIEGRNELYNQKMIESWVKKAEVVRRRISRNQPYEDIKVLAVFDGSIVGLSYGELYKKLYSYIKDCGAARYSND